MTSMEWGGVSIWLVVGTVVVRQEDSFTTTTIKEIGGVRELEIQPGKVFHPTCPQINLEWCRATPEFTATAAPALHRSTGSQAFGVGNFFVVWTQELVKRADGVF